MLFKSTWQKFIFMIIVPYSIIEITKVTTLADPITTIATCTIMLVNLSKVCIVF